MTKLKKYIESLYEGRVGRRNYLLGKLCVFALSLILGAVLTLVIVSTSSYTSESFGFFFFVSLFTLILLTNFTYSISLTVKRLHDINITGAWSLLIFISPLNLALFIFLMLKKSDSGENRYGRKSEKTLLDEVLFPGFWKN